MSSLATKIRYLEGYTRHQAYGKTSDMFGFISDVTSTTETGFFPSAVDGSTSTYFSDHCEIHSAVSTESALVGGWGAGDVDYDWDPLCHGMFMLYCQDILGSDFVFARLSYY